MSVSRRRFLTTSASAGASLLGAGKAIAAPYQVTVQQEKGVSPKAGSGSNATGLSPQGIPLAIPSTMPMGSGAPLGGIGTGFVEIRADGCFHEWQIFNAGAWAQDVRSTTAPPAPGPQYLRFLLRTKKASDPTPQLRRLYLRSDESDTYTLPFVQDVQSIDYEAWFPMTSLRYNDDSIPIRVSAKVFSPFMPGRARDSGSPGFHVVYSVENLSSEAVEVSLAGFLNNPIASALPERRLTNTLTQKHDVTSILLDTAAESDFPSGIGNMCISVSGGEHSYIGGTFEEYALPRVCRWKTPRVNYMLLSVLTEFAASGRLPNTDARTDPSIGLASIAQIDGLSDGEVDSWMKKLGTDALLARVFADARPGGDKTSNRELLKEACRNLQGKDSKAALHWGTGALASSVKLAAGEKAEIRFTLTWFFPHHLTSGGREMGHMYANWFHDAAEVNRFLCERFEEHHSSTERFARTLADTSCGDAMAFSWSSQLSTMVFNTWWVKDGSYAIWEGLGCCGLSTTDVDYQGSFPVMALFPELKLAQMHRIVALQNSRGQVPHNYAGSFEQVDEGGFGRVDMNPQFVMMVYRDYLWTGDKEYLRGMWPHVVQAMAFTESLDTNGDGLPDKDTGFQTYDQWRMRGTPSYIASLWVGALRAAVRIAVCADQPRDAKRWSDLLAKASASFDAMLFNGEYYSLWVDGKVRDEMCMTDQVSGEWFTHIVGLPSTILEQNLKLAIQNIFKNNFNPEFGLHNATAPKRGMGLLALNNLQAGGLWSGIEFAFASFLMDHGHYVEGQRVVEAIHRRYLRAGQPWNHVECGGHYSRAMSSWATMLAAAGFKPDVPNETLAVMPTAPGEFRTPWVMASGFGTISRSGRALSIYCASGTLKLKSLKVPAAGSARIGTQELAVNISAADGGVTIEFSPPLLLNADQTLTVI